MGEVDYILKCVTLNVSRSRRRDLLILQWEHLSRIHVRIQEGNIRNV